MIRKPVVTAIACVALGIFASGLAPQDSKSDDAKSQSDLPKTKEQAAPKAKRGRRPPADPHAPWGTGVQDGSYMGRVLAPVMTYLGADWLIRPEREVEEEPERMLDALELKPGMIVADVGAGVGYTSVRIAKRVAPGGKVLASDIQPEMIRMLKQNLKTMKLEGQIEPILCTADDPKLPAGEVDLAIMVDVYHECTHPVETLRGIHKALKPKGRLVLIEFRAEDPEVPIKPEHKMTAAQAKAEVESQGFTLAQKHDFLPWQHILVFEKNSVPGEKPKDTNP